MYNLLYYMDAKLGAMTEQDTSRTTSADMKFIRSAKCTWRDEKTIENIFSVLKINPVLEEI